MPRKQSGNRLHLPDLTIKGFRGIKSLSLPQLGRVTLLAGKNSVGKTSVLEAVAAFAARGRRSVLFNLLEERNEWISMTDEDGDEFQAPDIAALFYGRTPTENPPVMIGPSKKGNQLRIEKASLGDLNEEEVRRIERFLPGIYDDDDLQLFKTVFQEKRGNKRKEGEEYMLPQMNFQNSRRPLWRVLNRESELPAAIKCETLGPGLLDNDEIARFWDEISLTDNEDRAVEALRLIFGDRVDRIAVIGDEERSYKQRGGRRVMVKLKDQFDRVPLKSLGDGAIRLFSVALALVNSRDGILLIDEAENGIHHSVQRNFWRMVLQMARENNTQVLATTHSWDCVRGFAQAAADGSESDCVLVRLDRNGEEIRAVEYSCEDLATAAEQGIEVR